MHHTIEIAVPTESTEIVLTELEALKRVLALFVVRGASVKPAGDVVTVHALNGEVDAATVRLVAVRRVTRRTPG